MKCTDPSGLHCWERGCTVTALGGHDYAASKLGDPCPVCADCEARRGPLTIPRPPAGSWRDFRPGEPDERDWYEFDLAREFDPLMEAGHA